MPSKSVATESGCGKTRIRGESLFCVCMSMPNVHRAYRPSLTRLTLGPTLTLTSIGDGVISTDTDGRITFLNTEAERLTGWKNTASNGRQLSTRRGIGFECLPPPLASPARSSRGRLHRRRQRYSDSIRKYLRQAQSPNRWARQGHRRQRKSDRRQSRPL